MCWQYKPRSRKQHGSSSSSSSSNTNTAATPTARQQHAGGVRLYLCVPTSQCVYVVVSDCGLF